MNKILVQLEKGDEQEVEFEQPVEDIQIINASWKSKLLSRRGIVCFLAGMIFMYLVRFNTVAYNPSSHVVISQEAYYDLVRQNIHWDNENRTWNVPSP